MAFNRIGKIPIEKRIQLKQVKGLIEKYIKLNLELSEYNIRILEYAIGGRDNLFMIAIQDRLTHKPMIIDYSKEN